MTGEAHYLLSAEAGFSAAHTLPGVDMCERFHGHNWRVRLTVRVPESKLDELGMGVDFRQIERVTHEVVAAFEHRYLNDLPEFADRPPTAERDVAFAGASQVVAAFREGGAQVSVIDTINGLLSPQDEARYLVPSVGRKPPSEADVAALKAADLGPAIADIPALREADIAFLVIHGKQGEGGELQALLDLSGIPYTGSDMLGSALAMDKDIAKRLFRAGGVPTPDWVTWPAPDEAIARLGLPLVVKPSREGSTVGLSVVKARGELDAAVRLAKRHDDQVILEQFIPGREFTVGVLGERALAVGEIIPSHEIFDYECKYTPGMCREVFPAALDPALATRMRELALAAHRALRLRDFSRVDFRLDNGGTPYCLEVNTLPGMTRTSLFPQSAAAVGIDFAGACREIADLALRRAGLRNKVGA